MRRYTKVSSRAPAITRLYRLSKATPVLEVSSGTCGHLTPVRAHSLQKTRLYMSIAFRLSGIVFCCHLKSKYAEEAALLLARTETIFARTVRSEHAPVADAVNSRAECIDGSGENVLKSLRSTGYSIILSLTRKKTCS